MIPILTLVLKKINETWTEEFSREIIKKKHKPGTLGESKIPTEMEANREEMK